MSFHKFLLKLFGITWFVANPKYSDPWVKADIFDMFSVVLLLISSRAVTSVQKSKASAWGCQPLSVVECQREGLKASSQRQTVLDYLEPLKSHAASYHISNVKNSSETLTWHGSPRQGYLNFRVTFLQQKQNPEMDGEPPPKFCW